MIERKLTSVLICPLSQGGPPIPKTLGSRISGSPFYGGGARERASANRNFANVELHHMRPV